jgi:UDP-N-acetylmuramoylalanine--D-glutamate ligase
LHPLPSAYGADMQLLHFSAHGIVIQREVVVKTSGWCDYRTMRVAILGFGREGKSVLRFLQNRGLSGIFAQTAADKKNEITVLDKNRPSVPRGVKTQLGKNYLKNLRRFDLIFRSPGVPYNLPELKSARMAGVKFSGAIKLFFENCPAKNIIGITGTKGKGTTSTLLYQILRAAKKPVFLAGNIGKSALDIMPKLKKNSLVILELSSFQLQDLEKSPHIAAVLEIFPDHQDAHLNLREYYEAKASIARHQLRGDKIFFFKNNPLSRWVASKSRGKKIAVDENRFKLFGPEDLKIPGAHNFKNAAMAATIALKLGVSPKIILRTVKKFRGLEHRLEFVRKIGKIKFYNDSASTNPHTAAAAVRAFSDKGQETRSKTLSRVAGHMSLILIAGGQDKGLDYAPLARALKNSDAELVVLLGKNKKKIARAIKKSGMPIKFTRDLKTAVKAAYKFALKPPTAYRLLPAVILFSPGAASFDMFKNYADRGRQFKKLVKKIK